MRQLTLFDEEEMTGIADEAPQEVREAQMALLDIKKENDHGNVSR